MGCCCFYLATASLIPQQVLQDNALSGLLGFQSFVLDKTNVTELRGMGSFSDPVAAGEQIRFYLLSGGVWIETDILAKELTVRGLGSSLVIMGDRAYSGAPVEGTIWSWSYNGTAWLSNGAIFGSVESAVGFGHKIDGALNDYLVATTDNTSSPQVFVRSIGDVWSGAVLPVVHAGATQVTVRIDKDAARIFSLIVDTLGNIHVVVYTWDHLLNVFAVEEDIVVGNSTVTAYDLAVAGTYGTEFLVSMTGLVSDYKIVLGTWTLVSQIVSDEPTFGQDLDTDANYLVLGITTNDVSVGKAVQKYVRATQFSPWAFNGTFFIDNSQGVYNNTFGHDLFDGFERVSFAQQWVAIGSPNVAAGRRRSTGQGTLSLYFTSIGML